MLHIASRSRCVQAISKDSIKHDCAALAVLSTAPAETVVGSVAPANANHQSSILSPEQHQEGALPTVLATRSLLC